MAGQDANTLVQLKGAPNVRADCLPISEGLEVSGQHYSGSLENDRDSWIGLISRFLPVGFYYRAFYGPGKIWEKFWEPIVRAKSGLGRIDLQAHHDYFDKAYGFYDLVVVGGGPAGLSAAIAAARAGAEVLLVDENPVLGGALNYARFDVEGTAGEAKRQELIAAVTTGCRSFAATASPRSAPASWCWPAAPSSSRRSSATTTCRASCRPRRRSA
jgi:sarcosine oxidase subunit alpha